MASLDDKIADLQRGIAELTNERRWIKPSDETNAERRELLAAITATTETLNLLLAQKNQLGMYYVEFTFQPPYSPRI